MLPYQVSLPTFDSGVRIVSAGRVFKDRFNELGPGGLRSILVQQRVQGDISSYTILLMCVGH